MPSIPQERARVHRRSDRGAHQKKLLQVKFTRWHSSLAVLLEMFVMEMTLFVALN